MSIGAEVKPQAGGECELAVCARTALEASQLFWSGWWAVCAVCDRREGLLGHVEWRGVVSAWLAPSEADAYWQGRVPCMVRVWVVEGGMQLQDRPRARLFARHGADRWP